MRPVLTRPRATDAAFGGNARAIRAFAFLLALAASGCTVGPDFATPSAPVAEKYLESASPSVQSERQEYRDWWTVFHDPTLDRLIKVAYDQNLSLLAAGTRVLEARAQLGVAIGEFYPQVQDATASLDYAHTGRAATTANPSNPLGDFWRASLGVQIEWELDFWGKFRRGVESADAAYLASIASYDDVLVTLLGDVATTYIGIRTLQRQIELAHENVVRQQKALAIAEERHRGGVVTGLDVYQAENVLGATEATIPQLTIQLQQGFNALRVLLGMAPKDLSDLLAGSAEIPIAPKDAAVGIPADLLRRRPDIREAELLAAAQSAQIGVAEADLYPAFTIGGSLGSLSSNINDSSLSDIFTHKGLFYFAGPSVQWNILNYGRITNNARAQDAKFQSLLVNYQNTVLKAQQEVENGISTFLQSRDQVDSLQKSVKAANSALEVATLQYRQGTRDFTTVLTAEQNLLQAENSLAVATGNVSVGLASVYRALGGGWQIREGNDFVPAATREEMRKRTDWGDLIPPANEPQPQSPGLPSPEDRGPNIRAPEW
jgi:NodT family efflux transporter outer membrane factor (OMF) lipoprotein